MVTSDKAKPMRPPFHVKLTTGSCFRQVGLGYDDLVIVCVDI